MIQYLRQVRYILGENWRKLPWLALLFLCSALLDLVGIGLAGPYVALVIDPRTVDGWLGDVLIAMGVPREQQVGLKLLGLALVGIFLLRAIAAISTHRAIIHFSKNQRVRLQSILMRAYQQLPYTMFLQRNSSEYIHGITSLTAHFAGVLLTGLRTVSDGILAIAIFIFLAWQNAMALALLAGLLLASIYGYDRLFRRNLRSYGEQANVAAAVMVRGVQEGIEGLKEVRILGKEEYFYRMVHQGARKAARLDALTQVITLASRYLLEVTLVVFVVSMVWLILLGGMDLQILVPTLGMFALAAWRLMPAANTLSTSLIQLRYNRDSISRLYRDLQTVAHIPLEARESPVESEPDGFRKLTLKQVQFTYPKARQPALKDISLQIRAGERIGLIGPSGSGKTTLVDMLLGLLEPQVGELRYNDRTLKEALAQWRAQVAYLPQQVFLIDDQLRRNVALGVEDAEIDEARVSEALRQACLEELVRQLPDGVDTFLGERGVRLSGGQRQRVALARAFYHGRSVLVMDESTSALDNDTEREIVDEIRQLKGRKTLIVIAHRLTTVQYCDWIYRLQNGAIVEQGTYESVVQGAASAGLTNPRSSPASLSGSA